MHKITPAPDNGNKSINGNADTIPLRGLIVDASTIHSGIWIMKNNAPMNIFNSLIFFHSPFMLNFNAIIKLIKREKSI